MKIAPGIHRIGGSSMINAYLAEQAGEVTVIDAGVPGYYGDIDRELAAMGRAAADVRALVLTHGHSGHIGFAGRLRRERAVPVPVHEAGAALARGEVPDPSRGPVRSNSGRSPASCGSRCCTAGFAPPGFSRSRRSATGQPWTCREARGSS